MGNSVSFKLARERLERAKAILADYYGQEIPPDRAAFVHTLLSQAEELGRKAAEGGERVASWWEISPLPQKRIIEGYVNLTEGVAKEFGYGFWPGCWGDSLERYMETPVVLLDHDEKRPIGRTLELRETKRGLWAKVQIADGLPWADAAWALIKAGLIDGFSFRLDLDASRGQRMWLSPVIVRADLVEISVVTRPFDPRARFKIAEGLHPDVTLEDVKATRKLVSEFRPPVWWPKDRRQSRPFYWPY